jgi:hypothetical protein
MMATIYTLDQATGQRLNKQAGVRAREAARLAEARCRSRSDGERPVVDVVEGKGLIYRNFTNLAEVVVFEQGRRSA